MQPRILYIERKGDDLEGPGRIGRVEYSKTGSTLYYRDKKFVTLDGLGYKANYRDLDSGDWYWISGPKKDGNERPPYGIGGGKVEIDDDVREEYWTAIRKRPELAHLATYTSGRKYKK